MNFQRHNRPPRQPARSTAFKRYLAALPVIKDSFDILLKLATFSLIPASIFLWAYLKSLGWSSLFFDSTTSTTGLFSLVIAAVMLAFLTMWTSVAPSAVMIVTASHYGLTRTVPPHLPRMFGVALAAWILSFVALIALGDRLPFFVPLLVPLLAATVFGVVYIDKLELGLTRPGRHPLALLAVLALAAMVTFSVLITALPMMLSFEVASRYSDLSVMEEYLAVALCIGVAIVGVVPGFMYLMGRTRHAGDGEPLKMAFYGSAFVAYVVFAMAAFFAPMTNIILQGVGIMSRTPMTFQILDKELIPVFREAGLLVQQTETLDMVTAHLRYGFAGTKLLCKNDYDPLKSTRKAIQEARERKTLHPDLVGGLQCVPVPSDDLREFKRLPEPPAAAAAPAPSVKK